MKCNKTQPCSNCPFLKENTSSVEEISVLSKLSLSEKDVPCKESSGIRCAGAIIHASLANKIFKDKKLRYYQERLGKSNEVVTKEELLTTLKK